LADIPLVTKPKDSEGNEIVEGDDTSNVTIIVVAVFGCLCCCIITGTVYWAVSGKKKYSKRARAERALKNKMAKRKQNR